MDDIFFYLPDFYDRCELNLLMCDLLKQYPEYFYDNIKIGAVYGCFPGSIWNGGRVVLGGTTKEEMDEVLEEFEKRQIPIRYTFTNPKIEEKHVYDTFCNLCLKEADNGHNQIIINSPILETYIRKNYPDYQLISSTTKCLASPNKVEAEEQKDYSLIVLDNSFNNSEKVFQLPHPERFELIVNSYCQDNCPKRVRHYEEIGQAQLEFRSSRFEPCPYIHQPLSMQMKKKNFLTREQVYQTYVKAGFRHFKLDGRSFDLDTVMGSYLYYLVRPEYQNMIKKAMLEVTSETEN